MDYTTLKNVTTINGHLVAKCPVSEREFPLINGFEYANDGVFVFATEEDKEAHHFSYLFANAA